MTDRERWIVYPLIFLALGVALRDKITRTIDGVELIGGESVQMDFKRGVVAGEATRAQIDFAQGLIQADTIRCKNLIVEQHLEAKQAVTQRMAAHEIVVVGPDGKLRILLGPHADQSQLADARQAGGQVVVFGPEGKARVVLSPGTTGGEVAVIDKTLRLRLNFGGFAGGVMLEAQSNSGEKLPLLSLPPGLDPTKASPITKPESSSEKAPTQNPPDTSSPGPPEPDAE